MMSLCADSIPQLRVGGSLGAAGHDVLLRAVGRRPMYCLLEVRPHLRRVSISGPGIGLHFEATF